MGYSIEYKGEFTIRPPATHQEIQNVYECSANKMANVCSQRRNAEFIFYDHSGQNWEEYWSVSSNGDKINFVAFDRLYQGKGYLKYLIEHGIKPIECKVNGEMVFLNEYGSFGILGVENNEVYITGYLKEKDLPEYIEARKEAQKWKSPKYGTCVDIIPKEFNNKKLKPVTFRYDIAQKITRNTEFMGSLRIEQINDLKTYLTTRHTEKDYTDREVDKELKVAQLYNDSPEFLAQEERRMLQRFQSRYPYIAEYNIDGTAGDKSSKNEWILSDDKQKLVWSGKTFIAAHHWLAFLISECFDVLGSIKWVNETNELGLLTVERIGNLNYGKTNILFIEFAGKKVLANISWAY
jgi:hypothetical protein